MSKLCIWSRSEHPESISADYARTVYVGYSAQKLAALRRKRARLGFRVVRLED